MCGIAGIVSKTPRDLSTIFPMVDRQSHRGPDGRGFGLVSDSEAMVFGRNRSLFKEPFVGRVAFGHLRLSILDTSDAGTQPMSSADGKVWITYNGEVYNYIELRQELEGEGFRFVSGSDTEVIIAAYQRWGVNCFSRFNGMWAIALYDEAKHRIILARDRLGVKPLHYAFHGEQLVFASEIKGILAAGVTPRVNIESLFDYLRWGVVNHTHATFFSGIQALPPGCYAIVPLDRPTTFVPTPFWSLITLADEPPLALSEEELCEAFLELFRSAVSLRMRSDVQVGACLSGGVDSSSIVCMAAGMRPTEAGPLITFTSMNHDPRWDESAYARLVTDAVGTQSYQSVPDPKCFLMDLPALVDTQEEPFSTTSIYAQWLLMRAAREAGVTVLLDGQGADETLCGYRKYALFALAGMVRERHWANLLNHITGMVQHGDRGLLRLSEGMRYLPTWARRAAPDLGAAVHSMHRATWEDRHLERSGTNLRSRQIDDLSRYSVPALLRYEDRNSMAWSVESRVPFLDYRLVEFSLRLPDIMKVNGGRTKAILRKTMRGLVPEAILNRRDKMGFVTPQRTWLKEDLGQAVSARLQASDFALGSILDTTVVRSWLDQSGYWTSATQDAALRVFLADAWARHFDVSL